MPTKLVWKPKAREDLLDIYVAVGRDNPEAAERLYTSMEAKADLLIRHPRLGVRRPEIRKSARMLVEGSYLLLYQTHPDTDSGRIAKVEIVRVIDGRRNLSAQFDPTDPDCWRAAAPEV